MQALPYLKKIILLRDKIEDAGAFPFCLPLFQKFDSLEFDDKVTFLVGENGSGKSTLVEALAVLMKMNAEGGSRNFNFNTYRSHSDLHKYLRPSRGFQRPKDSFFLRAESFYNVATEVERLGVGYAYGDKSLHAQSHGESFWTLLQERLFGHGLYILDEPEAALSPMRQMAALTRIHDLVEQESQFIIATHSPILLSYPNATIYEIRDGAFVKAAYEETELYRVTKGFLDRYRQQLDLLLSSH